MYYVYTVRKTQSSENQQIHSLPLSFFDSDYNMPICKYGQLGAIKESQISDNYRVSFYLIRSLYVKNHTTL